jgi:hypothetical protein
MSYKRDPAGRFAAGTTGGPGRKKKPPPPPAADTLPALPEPLEVELWVRKLDLLLKLQQQLEHDPHLGEAAVAALRQQMERLIAHKNEAHPFAAVASV